MTKSQLRDTLPTGLYNELKSRSMLADFCRANGIKYTEINRNARGYWTEERCIADAAMYSSINKWRCNSNSAYNAARSNGWFATCTAHMIKITKSPGYWTEERCIADAINYESKKDWVKNSGGAYGAARLNGWLDKCCAHMINILRAPGYWRLDTCLAEALSHKNIAEWRRKSEFSYKFAKKNGWLNECTKHMKPFVQGYWTLELCKTESLKHNHPGDWKLLSYKSYVAAKRHGWLKECTAHMTKKPASNKLKIS
jgi:hypothetical protein